MGGLKSQMKITWWTFLLGTLAIVGAPPFSGFFSKDLILEKAFYFHPVFFGMGIATAFLTTFYMFRLTFLAFTGKSRVSSHVHPHESPWTMTLPLVILALGAAFSGYLLVPESLGGGIDFLEKYFSPVFAKGLLYYSQQKGTLELHHLSHELELLLAGLSLGAILLGVGIYWFFFGKKEKLPLDESSYTGWRILPANKYFIDEIFKNVLIGPVSAFSEFLSEVVEKRLIDRVLTGTGKISSGISSLLRRIQTGTVVDYAFLIVLGTVLILSVFLWRGI